MTFPKYSITPLGTHIDGGFGAMADSFMKAAQNLSQDEDKSFSNKHLPTNFLYRHAIELYLKSIIIVVHSSLGLAYGPHSEPHILLIKSNNWCPITKVHSVKDLYQYFEALMSQNQQAIIDITHNNWADIPSELKDAIVDVAKVDDTSTYFRYPSMKDDQANNHKSAWQETRSVEINKSNTTKDRPIKVFVEVNDQDEVEHIYKFNFDPIEKISKSVQTAATILQGAHLGLRVELANGN